MTELGLYSAVSLLGYYPMSLLGKFLMGLQMPIVAGSRLSSSRQAEVLDTVAGDTTVLAIAFVVGFALVTPFALVPLFGSRFAQSTTVIALIGFLQALRLLRNWPSTVALGMGRSLPLMVSNIVRLLAFPVSVSAVALGFGMAGLISGFIIGDIVAALTNLVMVNVAISRNPIADVDRVILFTASGFATTAIAYALRGHGVFEAGIAVSAGVAVAIVAIIRERRTLARCLLLALRLAAGVRRNLLFQTN